MVKKTDNVTYDYSCFHILAYEYGVNKLKDSAKKIKAKLKYYNLGAYDGSRVNRLRELKEELAAEIHLYDKSKYYAGRHGEYSNMEDFDHEKITNDIAQKYHFIERKELGSIVMMAIDLFYLR